MEYQLELTLSAENEASTADALQWVANQIKLGHIQASNFTSMFRVNFLLVPCNLME